MTVILIETLHYKHRDLKLQTPKFQRFNQMFCYSYLKYHFLIPSIGTHTFWKKALTAGIYDRFTKKLIFKIYSEKKRAPCAFGVPEMSLSHFQYANLLPFREI